MALMLLHHLVLAASFCVFGALNIFSLFNAFNLPSHDLLSIKPNSLKSQPIVAPSKLQALSQSQSVLASSKPQTISQSQPKPKSSKSSSAFVTTQQYRTDVEQAVLLHSKDVRACKKRAKPKKGRLVIAWEMDERGKARNFTKGEDTVENEKLYHCLIKKMVKWKFSAPPNNRPLDVEHLFVF